MNQIDTIHSEQIVCGEGKLSKQIHIAPIFYLIISSDSMFELIQSLNLIF
jgi:hypothetical protein